MDIINCKTASRIFLKKLLKVSTIFATIFTIFGFSFDKFLNEHWALYVTVALSLIFIISLVLLVNYLIKMEIADKTNISIPKQLLDIVSKLTKAQSEELSGAIARYLHLNGHHQELIELGKLLTENRDIKNRVFIKIDLLGWANHINNQTDDAITNIKDGVELAKENNLYYWAAKGERHLAAIEKDQRNETEYQKHLDLSRTYTKSIQNNDKRTEMEGSLHLIEAKHLTEQKKFPEAEEEAKKALDKLSNDKKRQLKVYVAFGNIYLGLGKWEDAYDMFLKGYNKSKGVRKDERAKNAVGLAKIHLNTKATFFFKIDKAKEYLKEAESLKESLKPRDRNEIESLLKLLR